MTEIKPFVREERFIVIKRKHLSPEKEARLRSHLRNQGVSTVECVVVESDWPEYETVWRMIEARVAGRPIPDPSLLNGLREAREALAVVYEWADQFANGALWHFRDQEPAKAAKVTLAHLDTLLAQEEQS